jgi:homoserine kinase
LTGAVRVRVPATSANLGPGFDALGLALSLHDDVDVEMAGSGLSIEVSGEGEETAGRGEEHLIARTFRSAYGLMGGTTAPGLRIRCVNRIPHARGLGSSSAATVAGILAARALHPDGEKFTDDDVLALATRIEGHPDNVAPCLLGGATLSWTTDGVARAARIPVHDDVRPVVLVPDATLSTHVARGLLPDAVPHADAAFNAGRAALLVHALVSEPTLLFEATEDRLHQRQRAAAMPDSARLLERLRAAGHAAVVSGAGPSLLVLTRRHPDDPAADPAGAVRVRDVADLTPEGWSVLPLGVDVRGSRVHRPGQQVSSR